MGELEENVALSRVKAVNGIGAKHSVDFENGWERTFLKMGVARGVEERNSNSNGRRVRRGERYSKVETHRMEEEGSGSRVAGQGWRELLVQTRWDRREMGA